MLEQVGLYNDLSPKLRTQLEEKIASFGKRVRYKFDISHPNPDPQKVNGAIVWPFLYTLDPITFPIVDTLEDRKDKQKVKRIGIVEMTNEKGEPNKFKRIRVPQRELGIKDFDLTKVEDIAAVMYLEMHPKQKEGMFSDRDKLQVFERVDENKLATERRTERSARVKALNAAESMSNSEVKRFADAMTWDSTEEVSVLRNMIEELAETTPIFFNEFIESKAVEYQAVVKQATDKQVVMFDPVQNRYVWVANNQTITILSGDSERTENQKFAEWLVTGGQKADEIYKKIKSLIK